MLFLRSIRLQGFRSFAAKTDFSFHPKLTLIIGPNSVGKTNLLEAVYCLSYGQGFREHKTRELINKDQTEALLEAELQNQSLREHLKLRLKQQSETVIKSTTFNHIRKNLHDFLYRTMRVVLFQPEDLLLITHTPDLRRKYFDRLLCRWNLGYLQARRNYYQGLYKRNKLLENNRNLAQSELISLIGFWDDYLKKQAKLLQEYRLRVVENFNKHPSLNGLNFRIEYQPNYFLGFNNEEQLEQELRIRRTLTGPQLDEYIFYKLDQQPKSLLQFGSRSEQRLCVLWLRINELRFLSEQGKCSPLLLMDDIFSELDLENSRRIMKVAKDYQTIITTAHQDILPLLKNFTKELKIITLTP